MTSQGPCPLCGEPSFYLGMATVSDEEVRQEVRRILESADLESISERKIKDQIAEKHGDIEPFKDLIRVSPISLV